MRIGIDVRETVGQKAGKGVYATEMVSHVLALDQKNDYVLYGRRPISFTVGSRGQVRVRLIRLPSLFWHLYVAFRARFIDRVDVFYAPTSYIIPSLLPHRCVIVVHDLYSFTSPKGHSKKALIIEKIFFRRALRVARHITCISEFTKRELVQFEPRVQGRVSVVLVGFDAAQVRKLHHMVTGERAVVAHRRFLKRLPKRFVLFVSTIEPRKNVARLIEALALARKNPTLGDLNLVLAGKKGWNADAILETIQAHSLQQHVHVLGFVTDAERELLYAHALVVVYPSLYEGFGIPPLEAMARGVAVLVSRAEALQEVVGEAGLFVDATDVSSIARGIEQLATSSELRDQLVRAGYGRVSLFSWEKSAATLLKILNAQA